MMTTPEPPTVEQTCGQQDFAFTCSVDELAEAIAALAQEDAISLPLIGDRARRRLLAAAGELPYRPARPLVGPEGRQVRQEFEICMEAPKRGLFGDLAQAFTRYTLAALERLAPPPVRRPFAYNDMAIQRYPPGVLGITPHRDHVRYEGIVALVILSGNGRFCLCDDRTGGGAREIPSPPGAAILMRGMAYGGRRDRPFHMLNGITEERISLGLRYDAQTELLPA